MRRNLLRIISVLAFIGMILSLMLLYDFYSTSNVCLSTSCEEINKSEYSKIGGIPAAFFGFLYFVLAFVLSESARYHRSRKLMKVLMVVNVIGFVFMLYLLIVMLFVLKVICSLCLGSDFLILLMVILNYFSFSIYKGKKIKKASEN